MSGMSEVTTSRSPTEPRKIRYGVMFARIGSTHKYKLPEDCYPDEKGDVIHLEVKDVSRADERTREKLRWFCTHPECAHKRCATKEELVRSHADQRILIKNEEKHLCMAVALMPPVKAKPAVLSPRGQIRKNAVGMLVWEEKKRPRVDAKGEPVCDPNGAQIFDFVLDEKGNKIVEQVLRDLPARLELFSDEE